MSDISISNSSISAIAFDSQTAGAESVKQNSHTVASGVDSSTPDPMESTVVGTEAVSRSQDYLGAGPDMSSTGTNENVQHAVSSAIMNGTGSIADKIV